MLCLYLSGIELVGRILQASKYGVPLKMELAEAKVAKTRAAHEKAVGKLKKLYDIRKEQRQEQLFKGNDVRQTVFWGNFEIHFWRYRFPMRKYFCFLKVMTMNHAHSSVRTQRSAYRAWPVVVQVNNVRSQLLSGVLTAISSIWVGCRTSVSETA